MRQTQSMTQAFRSVANPADGLDQVGAGQLGAHLRDVLVDGARAAGELDAPHPVEQDLAREHDARVLHEEGKEVELGGAQIDGRAGNEDLPARLAQLHVGELEVIGARSCGAAPQHRLDARRHLARAERLGYVVVGAELEAGDAVGLFVARRQHDDREARAGPHAPADLEPVHAGQPEVQHDQADRMAREFGKRLLAGAHGDDAVAVALQCDAHDVADVDLIFDDQHRAHSIPPRDARRGPSAP